MVTRKKGDRTRRRILEVAFDVIRRNGFQAAGLGEILATAGLTKGALYHHFGDKTALGYAVVDEIVSEIIRKRWIKPLRPGGDPLTVIPEAIRAAAEALDDREIRLGCPLANLAAEMSALDDGFAERIRAIYHDWRAALAGLLSGAESVSDYDPNRIATFIVATISGCLAHAKTTNRRGVLFDGIAELEFYIQHRAAESARSEPQYASHSSSEIEDYLL